MPAAAPNLGAGANGTAEGSTAARAHSSPAAAAACDSGVSIDSGATWPL
jgi:hypothetical protein